MPRLPFTPSTVRCRLIGTLALMPFNNVIHLKYAGTAPDSTALVGVGNAVLAAYQSAFQALLTTDAALTSCEATDLTSDTSAQGIGTTGFSGSATGAQDTPLSTAVVISFKINRHYRGGHPRMYLPLCKSTNITSGHLLASGFKTTVTAQAIAFRTALNGITVAGNSYHLVAVSYYDNKTLRPQGVPFDVASTAVHGRVDSMRSRLGKETA